MNKNVLVNLELDINRNLGYTNLQFDCKELINRSISNIKNAVSVGKILERNYSIRHDLECTKKENEYIKDITELDKKQIETLCNELLELKKQNIAMKKALKDNEISITITHLKYYGDNEQLVI